MKNFPFPIVAVLLIASCTTPTSDGGSGGTNDSIYGFQVEYLISELYTNSAGGRAVVWTGTGTAMAAVTNGVATLNSQQVGPSYNYYPKNNPGDTVNFRLTVGGLVFTASVVQPAHLTGVELLQDSVLLTTTTSNHQIYCHIDNAKDLVFRWTVPAASAGKVEIPVGGTDYSAPISSGSLTIPANSFTPTSSMSFDMITFRTVNKSADIAPTANFDFTLGYFRALDETGYVISW